jgi:nitrogen fixation NifU-like protein
MDDLRDLYQELILDHSRHPHNKGFLAEATARAMGHNPLCGDQLTLTVLLDSQDVVKDAKFEGVGCAISQASASLMTDAIKGKSKDDVHTLFQAFHGMVAEDGEVSADLGKLAAFAGVKDYPARVKCATLAWHTLEAALEGKENVTTE